jgi:hypothetical protein
MENPAKKSSGQTDIKMYIWTYGYLDKLTDEQVDKWADAQMERWTVGHIDKQR